MAGIVNPDEEQLYNPQLGRPGITEIASRTYNWANKPRDIVTPEGQTLNVPQYRSIVTPMSNEVSDRVISRAQENIPRGGVYDTMESVKPPTAPVAVTPAAPTGLSRYGVTQESLAGGVTRYTTPEGVMTAAPESFITGAHGRVSTDEIARRGVFGGIDQSRADMTAGLEGELKFASEELARKRSDEAMTELDRQRQLGIVAPTGMAAYEANAAQMRETGRIESMASRLPRKERAGVIAEGLKASTELTKTKIAGAAESEKSQMKYAADIYTAAAKSSADWAKLGIDAQDTQSKMNYRKSQVDNLMTRTGLLEPMKLQLSQAKDAVEVRKIQRDFAMRALTEDLHARMKEFEGSTIPGMPRTPEQQKKFENIMNGYQTAIGNINNAFPEEGQTRQFEDGKIGRFINGQWVDVTNQMQAGVVGR